MWCTLYDEPGSTIPLQIAASREGGCYLLAECSPPEGYKKDLLTLSFTAEGQLAWSARHETGLETGTQGMLARDDSDRLYVAGPQATDEDSTAIVLICYANNGKKLWQIDYSQGWLDISAIHTLAIGRSSELYLASTTEDWQRRHRLLICRFDPSGGLVWDSYFPARSEESFEAEGAAMAVTSDGRCIIAGEQRVGITAIDRLLVVGLDSAGRSTWQAGADGEATSRDICIDYQMDASGRLYVLSTSMEEEISRTFLTVRNPDGAPLWRLPLAVQETSSTALRFLSVDRGGAAYAGGTGQDQQGRDLFVIVRISADGELLWRKTAAAAGQNACGIAAQALDQQGNLVVTGSFYRTPTAADPGGDVYTFKLDPGGRLVWQAIYSGEAPSDDHPLALAVDASGHACVATVGKNREILRYDPDGKLLWQAGYGRSSTSYDRLEQLAIDPEQNIWLWSYTEDVQAGVRRQGVLTKFSPAGRRLWQIVEGDPQGFVRTNLLSVDSRGQATAAGYYWEGPEAQHYFVTRIDEEGKVLWRTVTGSRRLLDGLVDRQGCTWLLTEAGAGRREVIGFDDLGKPLDAWPVAEDNASRMLLDMNGRFYFTANQMGYGWSTFDLSCYAAGSAMTTTIPQLTMLQNYHNPFNISTTIRYAVHTAGRVRITIHDCLGREVAQPVDALHTTGWHEVIWTSTKANGLYFIRLQNEQGTVQKKMLLLR
ncbi:T9SS type A sorting domain-containing protein [bacterium]|nr:T9SS type A sorting domain-containing protein [bacterium]